MYSPQCFEQEDWSQIEEFLCFLEGQTAFEFQADLKMKVHRDAIKGGMKHYSSSLINLHRHCRHNIREWRCVIVFNFILHSLFMLLFYLLNRLYWCHTDPFCVHSAEVRLWCLILYCWRSLNFGFLLWLHTLTCYWVCCTSRTNTAEVFEWHWPGV